MIKRIFAILLMLLFVLASSIFTVNCETIEGLRTSSNSSPEEEVNEEAEEELEEEIGAVAETGAEEEEAAEKAAARNQMRNDLKGKIAYSSKQDGNYQIFLMDANGENVVQLTDNSSSDIILTQPALSPDGKEIAFISNMGPGEFNKLYIMDINGENVFQVMGDDYKGIGGSSTTKMGLPSWSPDGKYITVEGSKRETFKNPDIYIIDVGSKNINYIKKTDRAEWTPCWSPDGNKIVFVDANHEIALIDIESKDTIYLTNNGFNNETPVISPDGKKVAYVSSADGKLYNYEIFLIDINGENEVKLTDNDSYDHHPCWSPDGEKLAFISGDEILIIDVFSKDILQLTNGIQSFSWSK